MLRTSVGIFDGGGSGISGSGSALTGVVVFSFSSTSVVVIKDDIVGYNLFSLLSKRSYSVILWVIVVIFPILTCV
jgi:hypothetical protein